MATWIQTHKNGVLLKVKAVPNSSKNQISLMEDILKIRITAPAIDNRANQELIKFLSKKLGIKKKDIQIIVGTTSRKKQILFPNMELSQLENLINKAL